MSNQDELEQQIPSLDLDSEAKNQQRVQEIGDARSMARRQLTQTQPGNQSDEEILWRMLEAYILEVKPELQDTPLSDEYLVTKDLGEIDGKRVAARLGEGVEILDTNVKRVTGLLQYLDLGPRGIRITVARDGASRSSGPETGTVSMPPPRHISRNALEATNEAFGKLGYKLSHDEIDVRPDPI